MNYHKWRKATASNGSGNCVEVRHELDGTFVRDSKASGMGPALSFTPAEWDAFVAGVESGEFDR